MASLTVPSDAEHRPDTVAMSRYGGFVRRQAPLIAMMIVIGAMLGVLRAATVRPTYTSTITLLVPPVALYPDLPAIWQGPFAEPGSGPEADTLDTDAQLIRSGRVLNSLNRVPGFRFPREEIERRISITAPSHSRVLKIGVTANNPKSARAGAKAISKTFIKLRKRLIGKTQVRNRQAVNRRLVVLKAQLKALPPDPDARTRLTARTRRQALMKQVSEVSRQLAVYDAYASVIGRATKPQRPDDPGTDVIATSTVGLGLLGGLALGFVRDRRARRLRTVRDVRRRIALPILTDIAHDGLPDAGRRLRNLAFAENATTVLVTGTPADAIEPTATSLAAAFTHGGASTVLLLTGHNPAPTVRRPDGHEPPFAIRALPAGDGDRALVAGVERAHLEAEVVVVAGPPVGTAEAVTLATTCDLTFVTVTLKAVSDRRLIATTRHLERAAAAPRGIVIAPATGRHA